MGGGSDADNTRSDTKMWIWAVEHRINGKLLRLVTVLQVCKEIYSYLVDRGTKDHDYLIPFQVVQGEKVCLGSN